MRMEPTTIAVSKAFIGVPSEKARTNISEMRIISDWGTTIIYRSYRHEPIEDTLKNISHSRHNSHRVLPVNPTFAHCKDTYKS